MALDSLSLTFDRVDSKRYLKLTSDDLWKMFALWPLCAPSQGALFERTPEDASSDTEPNPDRHGAYTGDTQPTFFDHSGAARFLPGSDATDSEAAA